MTEAIGPCPDPVQLRNDCQGESDTSWTVDVDIAVITDRMMIISSKFPDMVMVEHDAARRLFAEIARLRQENAELRAARP